MNPDGERPIFVLGHPRSGTTLVRWLLDSHPRICCAGDSFFISAVREAFWGERGQLRSLNRLGISEDVLRRHVVQLVTSLYAVMIGPSGKPRWADKTNAYTMQADFIAWLFDRQCQFIVVVRHALDVASSDAFQADPWPETSSESGFAGSPIFGLPLEARLRGWSETNAYLHRFAARHEKRCYCIRYEDLVREPERRIHEMFAFLGEATPPDLLDRVFAEHCERATSGPVFEDYKIRETSKIETDRVDRWHDWPEELVASVAALINPTLKLWGYPDVGGQLDRLPGTLANI